ncbi:MAG: tRNA (adenosine(37)-N6)-threonylcarbamoyltransferase complex ATPase subunit type 1 TsaE [Myxococcales bacterium]|nr:tRNA (adenosine(37)-N6)-threonylcarbamoyltransferase complex ATPase subunit type 1 TsaE [Myxococcales bacterium]
MTADLPPPDPADRSPAPASLSLALADEAATGRVAAALARALRPGDAVLLEGELGAGKTTFVRAVARALGLPEATPVTSPTFTLVQEYALDPPLVHADLYRLGDPGELAELGLEERLGADAVCFVEWGARFADALGPTTLTARFTMTGDTSRELTLTATSDRGRALLSAAGSDAFAASE